MAVDVDHPGLDGIDSPAGTVEVRRFVFRIPADFGGNAEVVWGGEVTLDGALFLHAWNAGVRRWERLDACHGSSGGPVLLSGAVTEEHLDEGRVAARVVGARGAATWGTVLLVDRPGTLRN